ncbi:MAG: YlbF family regulator [Planctomycetaceae bacterium]
MEDLLALARTLGAALRAHERCVAFRAATRALEEDKEAKALEERYARTARALQEKSAAGRPLEPDEKRDEAALRRQVAAHPQIRSFLRAQADFQQLLGAVNDAISAEVDKAS